MPDQTRNKLITEKKQILMKIKIFLGFNLIVILYFVCFDSYFVQNNLFKVSDTNELQNQTTKPIQIENPVNARVNYHWILNKHLLQYSAYLIKKSKNEFRMEVFLFEFENWEQLLYCFIFSFQNQTISNTTAQRIISINLHLRKVICEFKNLTLQTKLYGVIFPNENVDGDTLYHELVVIDSTKPKIKSVGHCVHALYWLKTIESNITKQLEYWLQIQKKIGISEIRLYIYRENGTVLDYLKKKYKNYAIFVDFVDFDKFCGSYSNGTKFEKCMNAYKKILLHGGYMERVNTNDCYLNFKYKYEMVTNYDFDELIFPRSHNLYENRSLDCKLQSYCQYSDRAYNIYEYAVKMFNLMDNKTTACLMFINVAFLKIDSYLDNFMNGLVNVTAPTNVYYTDEVGKGIKIAIQSLEQAEKLRQYAVLYENLRCLSRQKKIDLLVFDRLFAFSASTSLGKSIVNTDFVETINQHSSDVMVDGTDKKELPIGLGYSSHLREYYKGYYLNRFRFVDDIFIDIEYYLFLLRTFEITKC